MKKPLFLTALSFIFLGLCACGFHLKGLNASALSLKQIYVMSTLEKLNENERQAYESLLEALKESGVEVLNQAQKDRHRLVVGDFVFNTREVAIGGTSGNSRELEIVDGYRIVLFAGDQSLGEVNISNRSNISYNAGQYIGSTQEERNTHLQLARDNAQSALRFINAKTQSGAQKSSKAR